MFPLSVKETLLSWQGSLVEKRYKKAWMAITPKMALWQEGNKLVFEGVDISINRMKSSFLCNLWSLVNLYSVEGLRSFVDFLLRMGCK